MTKPLTTLTLVAGEAQSIPGVEPDGLAGVTLTAELLRPDSTTPITIGTTIVDAAAGTFTVDFLAGDLIAGDGQLFKILLDGVSSKNLLQLNVRTF